MSLYHCAHLQFSFSPGVRLLSCLQHAHRLPMVHLQISDNMSSALVLRHHLVDSQHLRKLSYASNYVKAERKNFHVEMVIRVAEGGRRGTGTQTRECVGLHGALRCCRGGKH